ncbi:MAG: aspartate aminotransferase family protein [Candidatus Krumholzibacteria bacterium]|nr:aspartate aminotransferase family protein [Candidatus Krumholzibacteria bacterium]MDH4337371.1 aspartate aminotransferase family protein [Candidatus Krumholzibacteria bacterium]MDH5270132.1 aspartate aminotransferase family protein [Candidatus Krumholzibacteria bacterium]
MKAIKSSRAEQLLERRRNVVASGVGVFNTATAASASGAVIIDVDGNELIDFAGGIGVVNAGHCPPPVVEAIVDQARRFLHTSFNVVTYEPYVALCEKLTEIVPHGEKTKAMLVSTGAEAVENAIKIARQATRRSGILCFTDAFHGRTMMAMSLTSKVGYKLHCGPFAPGVYRLPFPNAYRYKGSMDEDAFVDAEIARLHESSHNTIDPRDLAAVIIEVVQGEGGFNVAPRRYIEALRAYCDEHDVVLIFDEVQSGFARTGRWSAWEHFGVTPDISTYAKSLGSGLPIAAVVGKAHIMDAAASGTIGGTYIGSPVCSAAALATIEYMQKIDLNRRGTEVGKVIAVRFGKMKARHPEIGDVRGLGAMMAMEFVKNGDPRQPDGELCDRVVSECARRGLVLVSAGTHKNIIRVLGPLVITDENLAKGLDILEAVVDEVTRGKTA